MLYISLVINMIDELNKRIIEVMVRTEHSKSTFAKVLDVSLPLITHITTGRNKPGLDIIQKLLSRFERINPDWLLLGTGNIYREEVQSHDFTAVLGQLEALVAEIESIKHAQQSVIQYHRILLDEVSHLSEMDRLLNTGDEKLQQLQKQLQAIQTELKSV